MAPLDPHSYTDGAHPVVSHAALAFYLDFASSTIHASALLTLSAPHSGDLLLDTRALTVHSASTDAADAPEPIPFSLAASPDPVLGTALTVTLPPDTASFRLTFSTSPAASALQWLAPPQTASGQPFVFSQCQSIHARSIFPCHDTPAARITFSLLLNVPEQLSAVASARHVARRDPLPSDHRGGCDGELWCAPGRIVEEFQMEQSVPPYLFAFAAGGIGSRDLGPRTRVFAEGGDKVLDEAAREFAGVEEMVKVGEALFGPYEWERFDLLVLPPSFPYGGMENPRMVFLNPTVIKGDAAGAQVVAHELAHSWAGNLITNKTNENFWLNEGFTTYAERRIVEVVQGEERAALNMGIGWRGLNRMMERFKDNMEFTKLKPKMAGIDPDDVYSEVPYEKGFQFLWRIELEIGRPAFDEFLKKYIATFKFQSIDTETFLEFLKTNVPGIENQIDLNLWVEGTGIPPDAMEPDSATYKKICSLAAEFKSGKIPSEDEVANWGRQEWELYLENLPTDVEASQVTALDERYKLSESRDYEVKVAFLQLAIPTGCKCYFNEVEKCLKQVGRMKYLRLLYSSLAKCSSEEKMLAQRIFSEAQEFYHPIARSVAESILSKRQAVMQEEEEPRLPQDIIRKIPEYISDPVSLARVASSSKLWRSIIKETAFLDGLMARHLDHGFTSPLLLGFFYQDNTEAPDHLWQHHRDKTRRLAPSFMPTSELLPFAGCKEGYNPTSPLSLGNFIQGIDSSLNFYEPVASQDSFLALCHHSKYAEGDPKLDVVCVCNPLTGEVFPLPGLLYKPPHHYALLVTDDINVDGRMTQSFRLVAIWNRGKKFMYVYYCSKSRGWWRPAGFPDLMAGLYLVSSSPAAASHGAIHWICRCWDSFAPSHIVTLHVDGEELLYLELPSKAKSNKTPLLANSSDGGLLLLLMKGLHMSVWKHKGTGTGDWVRAETIDMTSSLPMRVLKTHASTKIRLEIFRGKSGMVVLWIEGEGLFTFSLGDRSMRKIDSEHVTKKYRLCPYEIDWLSCLAVTNLVSDGSLSLDTEREKAQCRWRSLLANNILKKQMAI